MVLIQRSRGYHGAELIVRGHRQDCPVCKAVNPRAVFVDNCYGEFTETTEPAALERTW